MRHYWWECQMVYQLWKTVWQFLKRLNVELSYDPASPPLDIYPTDMDTSPHKDSYIYVHCGITCNSQKVEITQISIK